MLKVNKYLIYTNMRIVFRTFVVMSITVATFGSLAFCSISDEKVDECAKKIVSIMDNGHKERKIPGCVLVIVRHDKIVLVKPFGHTSIEKTTPITADTLFPISSVSKNITAFLASALEDAGKLKLNDKVRKYDKDFFVHSEEYSKELEIKDLICHGSGFPHFAANSLWEGKFSKEQTRDAFKYIKQIPGNFRKYYGYQNVFFGFVGDVLEKATGKKYEDLVEEYLFNKMNIKNASAIRIGYENSRWGHIKYMASRFKYDSNRLGFFTAVGNFIKEIFTFKPMQFVNNYSYYKNGLIEMPDIGFFHVYPATSGISFSGNEFAKWIQMILLKGKYSDKTIVSTNAFKNITSPVVDMKNIKATDEFFPLDRFPREELHYGLGTFVAKYADNGKNAHNILFHMGGVYGATAFFAVCPDEDIGVGVINNLGGTDNTFFAEYMCNNFLDLCFDFSKKDWVLADTNIQQKTRKHKLKNDELFSEQLIPKANLSEYEGTFTSDIYGDIKIVQKDNELILSTGKMSTKLAHVNGNVFSFPQRDMQLSFLDIDEYIAFYPDNNKKFNTCLITCFMEGDTHFTRKD